MFRSNYSCMGDHNSCRDSFSSELVRNRAKIPRNDGFRRWSVSGSVIRIGKRLGRLKFRAANNYSKCKVLSVSISRVNWHALRFSKIPRCRIITKNKPTLATVNENWFSRFDTLSWGRRPPRALRRLSQTADGCRKT